MRTYMKGHHRRGAPSRRGENEFTIHGDVVHIKLTMGKTAICDLIDWENKLKNYKWWTFESKLKNGNIFYARARNRGSDNLKSVYMHQLLINGMPDHKNRNGLDNRRLNLRPATVSQNSMNRTPRPNKTGYIGVTKGARRHNKWDAIIYFQRKKYHLGVCDSPEKAARLRDAKAKELHGEFAVLNFK